MRSGRTDDRRVIYNRRTGKVAVVIDGKATTLPGVYITTAAGLRAGEKFCRQDWMAATTDPAPSKHRKGSVEVRE